MSSILSLYQQGRGQRKLWSAVRRVLNDDRSKHLPVLLLLAMP